jgi:hypothetical protein
MSLRNMRQHGVRAVLASCQEASCGPAGSISVDDPPDDFRVPDVRPAPALLVVRLAEREDAAGLETGRVGQEPQPLGSRHEHGRQRAQNHAGYFHERIVEVSMPTWDQVLGYLQQTDSGDHQKEDGDATLGIADAEGRADEREGHEPFQIGRNRGHGPQLDRSKGGDSNGRQERPRDAAEQDDHGVLDV